MSPGFKNVIEPLQHETMADPLELYASLGATPSADPAPAPASPASPVSPSGGDALSAADAALLSLTVNLNLRASVVGALPPPPEDDEEEGAKDEAEDAVGALPPSSEPHELSRDRAESSPPPPPAF